MAIVNSKEPKLWHLLTVLTWLQFVPALCASMPSVMAAEDGGGLVLKCTQLPLQQVVDGQVQHSQEQTANCTGMCDFWWHSRHSSLVKTYLSVIRQHQRHANPRKLVFSSALHGVPYWGTQNKHINLAYSMAVASRRQLILDPGDEFAFVPRGLGVPRTIHFYMSNQEACTLAADAKVAFSSGEVPWLDARSSQPDSTIPEDEDVFSGPQDITWYLSNDGLRQFMRNQELMTRLYNKPKFYFHWFPPADVEGPYQSDDTLMLNAWRSALAAYAFCPRPWVQKEVACRLAALGLEPNKYIAIHMRRGDKVNNTAGRKYPAEGRLIPARDFFERAHWVRRTSLQPGCCDTVYVAFDVQSDLPEIQQAADEFGFKLVIDPDEERRGHPLFMKDFSTPGHTARVHPDEKLLETQLTDIKNTWAFVEAYTLVAADMSTFARFARALRGLDGNEITAGQSLAQNNLYAEWMPL